MEIASFIVDLFLHLDRHLEQAVATYHAWTYLLLFVIIFLETGLVVTPFLPGDSLLFAAGAIAALPAHPLSLGLLLVLLSVAGILGDTVNYWIGKYAGLFLIKRYPRLIKQEHLDKTHAFFEKYGGKTIIIARFVPIVRTLAPFVAGLGAMNYPKFLAYNVIGGIAWVALCTLAGYWFGSREFVKQNFSLVILAIVAISLIPVVWAWFSARASRPVAAGSSASSVDAPVP